jgi:hypothetical protein
MRLNLDPACSFMQATSEKTKAAQSLQSQSHASLASLASQSTDGPEAAGSHMVALIHMSMGQTMVWRDA